MRRFPEPEKSQYFDSAFSAYPTLNPLSTVPISWRALLPTVLPSWLNQSDLSWVWQVQPNTRRLARRPFISFFYRAGAD